MGKSIEKMEEMGTCIQVMTSGTEIEEKRRKCIVQHRQKQRDVYGGNIKNEKKVATCIQVVL